MIIDQSRRDFVIRAWCIAASPIVMSFADPDPRVYKLSQWRAQPSLRRLARAFEFLEKGLFEGAALGRHEIDGDRMYANVAETMTKAVETVQFEAHRKYIDVHYLVRGRELIGSTQVANLREKTQYAAETDVAFYERPRSYNRLTLNRGEFAVFFPGQAHLPVCLIDKPEQIRKVVVKILADSV